MKIIDILKMLFGIKQPTHVYIDVMRQYNLDAVEQFTKLAKGTSGDGVRFHGATAFQRGNQIEWVNGKWVYADDGTSADIERPCKRCGRMPTPEGHDACIGHIPGAISACCGHGVEEPILMMEGDDDI